jgi:hypothetical protein
VYFASHAALETNKPFLRGRNGKTAREKTKQMLEHEDMWICKPKIASLQRIYIVARNKLSALMN